MKSRRKQSLYRLVAALIAMVCFNTALYVVAVTVLQTRSEQIKAANNTLALVLPGIVEQLVLEPVQSLQWFLLKPDAAVEYTPQQAGVADSWPEPLAPTAVTVLDTRVGESVLLSWQAIIGQTYDGVEIYRSKKPATSVADMTLITTSPQHSGDWIDTSVENNTTYYYALRSYRGTGTKTVTSTLTDVYSVIPTDTTPPPAPIWLTVTPYQTDTDSGLQIDWQPATGDDAVTFKIYRSTQPGTLGEVVTTVAATVTTVLDPTITPGVLQYYTVSAVDATGNESTKQVWTSAYGNSAPFVTSDEQAKQQINGH